jgi:hypothetical protein
MRSLGLRAWLFALCLVACILASSVPALAAVPPLFVPVADRRDCVYDAARDILYVVQAGTLQRYWPDGGVFGEPMVFGGDLQALDISPDNTQLAIADAKSWDGAIRLIFVDLNTGASREATYTDLSAGMIGEGAGSLAYGADGKLLVAPYCPPRAIGWGWLTRFDPQTGQATPLELVYGGSRLRASGTRKHIAVMQSGRGGGALGRYTVATGSLDWCGNVYVGGQEVAVNADATRYVAINSGRTNVTDGNLQLLGEDAEMVFATFFAGDGLYYNVWNSTWIQRNGVLSTWGPTPAYDMGVLPDANAVDWGIGYLRWAELGDVLSVNLPGGVGLVNVWGTSPLALPASLWLNERTSRGPGEAATVGGRLTRSDNIMPGCVVRVESSADGVRFARSGVEGLTDAAGAFRLTFVPRWNTWYRVSYEGTLGQPDARSQVVQLWSGRQLTIGASAGRVRRRSAFVLSGVSTPGAVGDPVIVEVRKPGSARWSYSSARLVHGPDGVAGGKWWYRYRPYLRGWYSFRARVDAAVSRTVFVYVR